MKIALVHDYLREYGGAERVVEAIHEMWPKAPLYTSFVDWEKLGNQAYRFRDWDIRTSWVADNWLIRKFHSPLRFLAPLIWRSIDVSGYDVVISSSGWFMCRGIKAGQRTRFPEFDARQFRESSVAEDYQKSPIHICYIHHPPRNLYGYATGSTLQKYWIVRVYATILNFFLRHYDFETAQKVDFFIANSKETARRVKKFYRRESTVIYPPVEIVTSDKRQVTSKKKDYFLSVGRLTYSKRVDLATMAANKLKVPLKIVGTGSEEEYLKSIAGSTVEFLGSVSDDTLSQLYSGAKALIFCGLDEDFGMVPVEAMAHGVPVIALGQGGVLETVVDGRTGILFTKPTVESLVNAIKQFNKATIYQSDCIDQARKFSKERFQKELKRFLSLRYQQTTK